MEGVKKSLTKSDFLAIAKRLKWTKCYNCGEKIKYEDSIIRAIPALNYYPTLIRPQVMYIYKEFCKTCSDKI